MWPQTLAIAIEAVESADFLNFQSHVVTNGAVHTCIARLGVINHVDGHIRILSLNGGAAGDVMWRGALDNLDWAADGKSAASAGI
jgi:hypothetical protein